MFQAIELVNDKSYIFLKQNFLSAAQLSLVTVPLERW